MNSLGARTENSFEIGPEFSENNNREFLISQGRKTVKRSNLYFASLEYF